MSSIGTGYDLSVTTFSPDGRVFQIEYAAKAVDNSGTVVAIKCKDGVVMVLSPLSFSPSPPLSLSLSPVSICVF